MNQPRSLRMSPILAFLAACFTYASAAEAQPVFTKPDRIRYDGSCLTIEGKDTVIFSGAFHYFRCPPELWRDRFRKIKEAGCNAVETYVAWNFSEREMPSSPDDYSKMNLEQLAAWMKMAHEEFGLYTIIRPGPYICAEYMGGGYPRWLMLKKPAGAADAWLRSDEATYLAWCSHYMKAVTKVVAPEQITNKPVGSKGVILFQIENEYDFTRDFSTPVRVGQLKSLYKDAIDGGIDVPIFTCWTNQARGSKDEVLKNVFDASNTYPRRNLGDTAKAVRDLKRTQPNAPAMIAELQGGWFSTIGGSLSEDQPGIDATQVSGIALTAMQEGVTILNYYMLFGGTNFGDEGSRLMLTSYDYASPIREHGGVGDKYLAVKAVGKFVAEFGPRLARATGVAVTSTDSPKEVLWAARKLADDSHLIFVRNTAAQKQEGTVQVKWDGMDAMPVRFELAPFEVRVLHLPIGAAPAQGRWLPEKLPPIDRPAAPAPVRLTSALKRSEPSPTGLVPFGGKNLVELGEYGSPMTAYAATFTLTDEQVKKMTQLQVRMQQENPVALRVNGSTVQAQTALGKAEMEFDLSGKLKTGINEIELIHMALGYPNFGRGIEQMAGVISARLLPVDSQTKPLEMWKVKSGAQRELRDAITSDTKDAEWPSIVLNDKTLEDYVRSRQPGAAAAQYPALGVLTDVNDSYALYRATLTLTAEDIAAGQTTIRFGRIDDSSVIYINGKEAGRSSDWNTPVKIDASTLVRPGENIVAVLVHNVEGEGGLTKPVSLVTVPKDGVILELKIAPTLTGTREKWFAKDASADGWKKVELNTSVAIADRGSLIPPGSVDAPLDWYRMEFELPAASPDVWVPWQIRLGAAGQGELYLNGHHLGRWFEPGPQRQYYMPESWLNFGPGAKNVVTMALIPVTKGTGIEAAEVLPAAEFTEKRP